MTISGMMINEIPHFHLPEILQRIAIQTKTCMHVEIMDEHNPGNTIMASGVYTSMINDTNTPAERAKHVINRSRRRVKPKIIQITMNVTPHPTWIY